MIYQYREREAWIDSWRGLLIVLVVLGHVVGTTYHVVQEPLARWMMYVFRAIYLFHMPGFFFLAGALYRFRDEDFYSYVKRKFKRILVPYFVWGTISIFAFALFKNIIVGNLPNGVASHYAGMGSLMLRSMFVDIIKGAGSGLRTNAVLWFLPCFFCVEILCRIILVRVKPLALRLAITLGLFCLGGALSIAEISGCPYSLEKVPAFLAFMISGHLFYMRIKKSKNRCRRECIGVSGLMLSLLYLTIIYMVPPLGDVFGNGWISCALATCLAFVGIICSMAIMFFADNRVFESLGKNSLGIMLFHNYILHFIFFIGGQSAILASLSCVSCVAIIMAIFLITIWFSWIVARLATKYFSFAVGG